MEEFLEDCGEITIEKKLSGNTWKVRRGGNLEVMKIINLEHHAWNTLRSFHKIYNEESLFQRSYCIYKLFNEMGLTRINQLTKCKGSLLIFMPVLDTYITEERLKGKETEIRALITKMHEKGIFHGDLHGGNIAFDEKDQPVLIDLETVFFEDEWKKNPLVEEWLEAGFDIDDLDEFLDVENENWQTIIDN